MNFNLTPEQGELRESVRRFCEKEYGFEPRRKLLATERGYSTTHWALYAELGWLGAGLSEDNGGYGGGPLENSLILEQFGGALVLEPFLASAVMASQVLAMLATLEQRERLLAPLIDGSRIAVLAHHEPGGAAYGQVTLTAKRNGNSYVLHGRKSFILGGPSADLMLVSGRDEDGTIGLYAVDPAAAGSNRIDYHAVDGRRVSDFVLQGVTVPADARIGGGGTALPAIETALAHGITGLCAEAVGAMDAAIILTRDYLKTRRQFGAALGSFQVLQHRMADMHVESVMARSMLYRGIAALNLTNPRERDRLVAAMKVCVGEAGFFIGAQAIQLHGGIGITEEYIAGHLFKRLVLARNLFGNTDVQIRRFADHPGG